MPFCQEEGPLGVTPDPLSTTGVGRLALLDTLPMAEVAEAANSNFLGLVWPKGGAGILY